MKIICQHKPKKQKQHKKSKCSNRPFNKGRKISDKSTNSTISSRDMMDVVNTMRNYRHRDTTKKNYQAIWRTFLKFIFRLDEVPESWEDKLILFIGYLLKNKRQSATIRSYILAIKAILLSDGVKLSEDKYLVSSLTKACKMKNDQVMIREPIRINLLNKILDQVTKLYSRQPYLRRLYRALFSTAYFGMFRVGEVTKGAHPILAKDVDIGTNKKKLLFTLHSSKTHGKGDRLQQVKISAVENSKSTKYCPFTILREYLSFRSGYDRSDEIFFVCRDKSPVTPELFRKVLLKCIKKSGSDPKNFNSHSFRIGRSTDLRDKGIPIKIIRRLGRWKDTNTVYKYLREY